MDEMTESEIMMKITGTQKGVRLSILSALGLCLVAGVALADGDAVKGEQVFKKCAACHAGDAV